MPSSHCFSRPAPGSPGQTQVCSLSPPQGAPAVPKSCRAHAGRLFFSIKKINASIFAAKSRRWAQVGGTGGTSKKQEVGTGGRDRRYPMSSKCFPSGNILEVSSALFSSCPGQFCKAVPIFREGKTRPRRSRDKSGLGPGLLVNSRAPSPLCTQVSMNPAPNRALVGPSCLWAPRALHTAMPSGVTGQGHQRS